MYHRQSNLQIYNLLRSMRNKLIQTPQFALSDSILFEDALGRVKPLPYEWFRRWEVCTVYSLIISIHWLWFFV